MNIPELQKKIADVLGVSSSQKELAFEIFIDTVASILTVGITLKTPRVGFFQLKNESVKDEENKSLIFSSLPEDFSREDKNLYLTINVLQKSKITSEYDSNVFSIGVGKPLLPLTIDEMPDSETSYAMLRKSIEERVKELISESDQIPNFNVWDDYYQTDSETDLQSQDSGSKLEDIDKDFVFPGIGRSDIPRPVDKSNLLNNLLVDIPDFDKQKENREEKQFNDSDETVSKDDSDEFVTIKGVTPSSYGITIDDLLDDEEEDKNFENAETIEFEIPDSDLSKLLIEEPLAGETKPEVIADGPEEETISLNDFLDNSKSDEKTIDLHEYLNKDMNEEAEEQISLKDLGLDRESLRESKFSPEEKIELSFNDKVSDNYGDESGKQLYSNEHSYSDKLNEDIQQEDDFKTDIDEDKKRIEKSLYGFTIEIDDKNEPIEDPFDNLIASSKKAIELETKPFDGFKIEEYDGNLKSSSEGKLKEDEDANPVKPELIKEEFENFEKKSKDELETKKSELVDDKDSDDISEEAKLKSADEFEIINWPDSMEVKNNERIEWNWGDELKEEFGLGRNETEDIAFEEVNDFADNDKPLIDEDDIEEQEFPTKELFSRFQRSLKNEVDALHEAEDEHNENGYAKKDLFSRLERTLELEVTSLHEVEDETGLTKIQTHKTSEIIPKEKFLDTVNAEVERTASDIKIKNDEKVYLEFQGPPPKYQFVEDKSPLSEKRMAITLVPEFIDEVRQESSTGITKEKSMDNKTIPVPVAKNLIDKETEDDADLHPKRESYVKTFSIIISTLLVVGAVVIFFFIRKSNPQDQTVNIKPVQKESVQKPVQVDSQALNSSQQTQTQISSKASANLNLDESSDFPASATPPVPIRDQATDIPVSYSTKKESKAAVKQPITNKKPEQSKVERPSENNGLYRTLSTDTKVNGTIYYDGKSYNFQISSWRERLKAETEVKRLRSLGMTAFIVEAYLPQKGGKWFRVRVGSFKSEKQAEEYKAKNNF
jgi:cell division septation protein DedD